MQQQHAMTIDKDWFEKKIKDQFGSSRKLAKKIGTDPSSLSRLFQGKRKLKIQEAEQLSKLFEVSLNELLTRAGIKGIPGDEDTLSIVGYIADDGRVTFDSRGNETVTDTHSHGKNTTSLRFRGVKSLHDGWVFVCENRHTTYTPDFQGLLCVVQPRDADPVLAHIQRGYKRGTVNLLIGVSGELGRLENVTLDWVAPVICIHPRT